MTQRELKDQVKERIWELMEAREVYQRRPNTCVRLLVRVDGTLREALGFTKVRYPDEWSEEEGIELAEKKAIAWLTRELIKEYGDDVLGEIDG